MNEHAVDSMIYAWLVMNEKKKEENKMEGIFLGKVDQTAFDPRCISLSFGTKHLDQHVEVRKELDYDCDYVLVKADDVIKTNDELLRLRDEVKQWDDECSEWKKLYAKVNNELFQKGLAYGTLETAYKNEKIAGEMLLKDRDALKEKVEKLEAELTEIKTARTLREAYVTGVEKGCESLREERDRWKRRWNSVVTDISKSLAANGVEFKLKENDGEATWVFVIDIPELNEAKDKIIELEQKVRDERRWCDYWRHTYYSAEKVASVVGVSVKIDGIDGQHNSAKVIVRNDKAEELKKKVEDLEKKLKAVESKENYWRNRKEEEEKYHHYWLHTYNLAVGSAAEKGVRIFMTGGDAEYNVGVILVKNEKAEELEKQIVQMEDANQKLNQQVLHLEDDYQKLNQKYGAANNALEYWNNTYNDIVIAGKKVGVKIDIKGKKPDTNAGFVYVTNERALELAYKLNNTRQEHDKKWQAMLDAFKEKGIEVIYMGEEDNKPIIDVKVPVIDILKKELEDLKSRTLDKVEIRLSYGDIMWTYCDGFVHLSSKIDGMSLADQITTAHINCLCKNHVAIDAESLSHGTVPKCSSCAHYMHNPSRFAHDWCYKPVSKEGPGTIRRLSTEEAEGPACSDFKARKE